MTRRPFKVLNQILDPHEPLGPHRRRNSAPLVVRPILRDLFRARTQARRRSRDRHHKVLVRVGRALKLDLVVHQPLLTGHRRGFLDEVSKRSLKVRITRVKPFLDRLGDPRNILRTERRALMLVQDFKEPRHMRPLLLLRQRHIHVDRRHRRLLPAVPRRKAHRVHDFLHPDAINRDHPIVRVPLHIRHPRRLRSGRFLSKSLVLTIS